MNQEEIIQDPNPNIFNEKFEAGSILIKNKEKFLFNEMLLRIILVFVSTEFLALLVYNATKSYFYVTLVALFQTVFSFLAVFISYNFKLKKNLIFLFQILLAIVFFVFGYLYVLQKNALLFAAAIIPPLFNLVSYDINLFSKSILRTRFFGVILRNINQIGVMFTSFFFIFFSFLIDILPTKQSLMAKWDLIRILSVNDFYLIYVIAGFLVLIYALFFFFNYKDTNRVKIDLKNLSVLRKNTLVLSFAFFNALLLVSMLLIAPYLFSKFDYLKYKFTIVAVILSIATITSIFSPKIVYNNLRKYGTTFVFIFGWILLFIFLFVMAFFNSQITYVILGLYIGTLGSSLLSYAYEYSLSLNFRESDFIKAKFVVYLLTSLLVSVIYAFSSFALLIVDIGLIYKFLFFYGLLSFLFYLIQNKVLSKK